MWWCCDVEGTLMTSWIIKRGLTILRAHQWLSVQGEEADKDICLCLAHPDSLVIKGSGQNKAKLNQNMAIFCTYIFQQKIFIKWGNYDLVLHWLWYIWYSFLFIGPESDHWLCLSLTDWLTHWLTDSLPFSKLDWYDPGMWRWQLKTCWSCYFCWCWCWG